MLGLLRRDRHERTGFSLYGAAVAASRAPDFYDRLGVPDTLDGRFDMVGLHAWLVIRRLGELPAPGAQVAQAVFDAFFADMDQNLRELGVSDLAVGKRVKTMWEAFHGRARAYAIALDSEDPAALPTALARNVWRVESAPEGAAVLARYVRAQADFLATQPAAALLAGQAAFRPPEQVA